MSDNVHDRSKGAGRPGVYGAAFGMIIASALVLAFSAATRSLSSGLSWLSIALSLAGAIVAVVSLRVGRG